MRPCCPARHRFSAPLGPLRYVGHNKVLKPEGSYYAEGFPREGGDIGIYFVDPTSPERGMAPMEKAKPLFRKREGHGPI